MTKRRNVRWRRPWAAVWAMALGGVVGCVSEKRVEPVMIPNSGLGAMTIAVAPAINVSGSTDFDPNRFADLMASELSHADGISVIPVSRVLSVLAVDGLETVVSPSHALELARRLGADAILVFSVTEYDPYDPPRIGITAQLYGTRAGASSGSLDPVALSRTARLTGADGRAKANGVLSQSQRVFDASHNAIVEDVRRFWQKRHGDASPFGWRRYVVDQRAYIRFCCHATIARLLSGFG